MLESVRERAASYDGRRLQRAVRDFGSVKAKKLFEQMLKPPQLQ